MACTSCGRPPYPGGEATVEDAAGRPDRAIRSDPGKVRGARIAQRRRDVGDSMERIRETCGPDRSEPPSARAPERTGARGDGLPTVSIGMPVYNAERYLEAALASLLDQTFEDFELIISDNASTDRTPQICEASAAADGRVRYHRNPENLGIVGNYNAVVRRARGRSFKFASSNDLCHPTLLEKCVAVLERRPDVVLCYPRTVLFSDETGYREEYDDGMDLQEEDPCVRFRRCRMGMRLNNVMNGVVRTEALRRTGLMGEFLGSDVPMIVVLTLYGKFVELPEFLFFRRMEPAAATSLKNREEKLEYWGLKDPGGARRPKLRSLESCFEGVWHGPLSLPRKLRLTAFLLRSAWWTRHRLLAEVGWSSERSAVTGGKADPPSSGRARASSPDAVPDRDLTGASG